MKDYARVAIPFVSSDNFNPAHKKSQRGGDVAHLITNDAAGAWSLIKYCVEIGGGVEYMVIVYRPMTARPSVYEVELIELSEEFRNEHPGYYWNYDKTP